MLREKEEILKIMSAITIISTTQSEETATLKYGSQPSNGASPTTFLGDRNYKIPDGAFQKKHKYH